MSSRCHVPEFVPYVFQLLSMLLELRVSGEPIPGPYMELYKLLFTPVLWERSGNVHPLVRLLTAYISKMNPSEMAAQLQLVRVGSKCVGRYDYSYLYTVTCRLSDVSSGRFSKIDR